MYSVELIRDFYTHMEWADGEVWRAVGDLDPDLSDEFLHRVAHHLHATQQAFMNYWAGRNVMPPDASQFSTLEDIRSNARPFYEEATVFLTSLEDSDLERAAVVPWAKYITRLIDREPEPTMLGQTLFQVAMHSAYHRGQINRRLRELGAEPPLVDYIVWIWQGRPEPEWEDDTRDTR